MAVARRVYEFDAHGVEMNHRYISTAVAGDGAHEPKLAQGAKLI
jgi:2,4-dichlorophenol 6-monooxygenase